MSAATMTFGRHSVEPKRKAGISLAREFLGDGEFFRCPGLQWEFKFANGYGASVINDGYGRDSGLYELAVIGPDGGLDYTTPITDDVLGWLTPDDVAEALDKIEALA